MTLMARRDCLKELGELVLRILTLTSCLLMICSNSSLERILIYLEEVDLAIIHSLVRQCLLYPYVKVITVGDSPRAGHRQRSSQQGHGGGFFSGFPGFGDMGMGFSSFGGGGGGATFTSFRLVANHLLKMIMEKYLGTPHFH